MDISLKNKDLDSFKKLLETKDLNINLSSLLIEAFQYIDLISNESINEKRVYFDNESEAIKDIILDEFGVDDLDFRKHFHSHVLLKKCNPKDYLNKYVELISSTDTKYKNYSIRKLVYKPYQLFALDEIDLNSDGSEILKVGYFEKEFSYTALFEKNNCWMSVNPNEILTMSSAIEEAKGNVLILGLGMGYIAYMCSLQSKVKNITVIEKNPDNISLMKQVLRNKISKIKIIQDDAINYLENNHNFDYIFADLWFTPEDGLPLYLNLKKIENKYNLRMRYWLEKSLKQMRNRYLIELINEQLNGATKEDYLSVRTPEDLIFNRLYFETQNLVIKSFSDIEELLKWDRLKKFL